MIKESQILIISPEPWDGHFVSKHHYAVTLAAKGYRVYFLDPPDASCSGIEIKKTDYENLWSISAPMVAKGLRFYPSVIRRLVEARWLMRLEQKIGSAFSTVWLFENSRFYDMDFAGERLKIYHQVDLNQNFHVKEAASAADICFCTTDYIKRKILPFNKRVYKIHHGVTLPSQDSILNSDQKQRFESHHNNAVYVGNLDISYLDLELLGNLVDDNPEVQFHFVGKYSKEGRFYAQFAERNNVTFWGQVASQMIPAILECADVVLITYSIGDDWEKAQMASPHKVMEYLASGKVTVATYTDEYKDKRHLLEMVDDSKEYLKKFEEVVDNLNFYNSSEKQQERIDFAQEHSYEKQLEKISKYIRNR